MPISQGSSVLIVGAGTFGLSTAFHLLKRGYTNVHVIDKAETLPALDAASTDINKVVRSSYSKIIYASLAHEAIELWKNTADWDDAFHQSGVLVLRTKDATFTSASLDNERSLGERVVLLPDRLLFREEFPSEVPLGDAASSSPEAYVNRDHGWAFAAKAIKRMMEHVLALGGKIIPGTHAVALDNENGKTTGIRLSNGEVLTADLTVLACGSWTPSAFPSLAKNCVSTGQTIATIQLTSEAAARYAGVPVVIDYATGFYILPPNEQHIVKAAIHAAGFVQPPGDVPLPPRTILTHGVDGLRVPKQALAYLRAQLKRVYPELAMMPFSSTRLCWYNDTPDGDWIIDFVPGDSGLVLATGGSGHAFKFLPNIGGIVADKIEGSLDAGLSGMFALERDFSAGFDFSRKGETSGVLQESQLCTASDLAAGI